MTAQQLFVIPGMTIGGAEILLTLQLAEFRRRGLAPRLLILSNRIDRNVLARTEIPPEHVYIAGLSSAVLDATFLRQCPAVIGNAAKFLLSSGCTDIVASLPPAHFFTRLLKLVLLTRFRRVRLFQYHHSEEVRLSPRDSIGKKVFFAVDRFLARCCDWAHWHVSEKVRADVAAGSFTRRDAVLHNTCDMTTTGDRGAAEALIAPLRGGANPFIILLPGRLLARKGHQLLLRAVAPLIAREKLTPEDIRIVFAGDGPERAAIESVAAEAGLAAHVTLLGSVPHAALLAMYELVDLVVVPSLVEGFGIVAIEALSRGALLIASDAAGLDEIVHPGVNALQFPVGDREALAALLVDVWSCRGEGLIDRSRLRKEMLERFGVERHIDRMLELLSDERR